MNNPEDITAQIERLKQQIEELLQQIKELLCSPICNEEGEIVLYQDHQDWLDN